MNDRRFRFRCGLVFVLALAVLFGCGRAQKARPLVKAESDLPPVVYPAPWPTQDLIKSGAYFRSLADPVSAELLRLDNDPAVQSRHIRLRVTELLAKLDLLTGNYRSGLRRAAQYRELQTKAGPRLTGLLVETAYMKAALDVADTASAGFRSSFRTHLQEALHRMSYDVAWFDLVGIRGAADSVSEEDVKGDAERTIEPTRSKGRELNRQMAWQVVDLRCQYVLCSLRHEVFDTVRNEEASHGGAPKGIWSERAVNLQENGSLHPVIVAIWDTGVDSSVFGNRMWTNNRERNGTVDHDGNGYPGDVHGISFGPKDEKVSEATWPLSRQEQMRMDLLSGLTKGSLDVFGDPGSPEASLFKKTMATVGAAEREQLEQQLAEVGYASHGTSCADIAVAGNPMARILSVRMSSDSELTHIAPTRESGEQHARVFRAIVAYLKQHGARVVNMSWIASAEEYEKAIEKYGHEQNAARRRQIAQEVFNAEKEALIDGFRSAPEILFVAGAGNDDQETTSGHQVPADLTATNLITVGAVDPVGNPVSFSNYGPGVQVYASAFTRARMLGGKERIFVGTSAAAPQVVNLAAKLLAINPGLSTSQVVDLIQKGALRDTESRLPLLNPKRSVALLQSER
jgi:hypothetical protein